MIQIKIMLIFIINYSKDISKKATNENALIDTAMEDDNIYPSVIEIKNHPKIRVKIVDFEHEMYALKYGNTDHKIMKVMLEQIIVMYEIYNFNCNSRFFVYGLDPTGFTPNTGSTTTSLMFFFCFLFISTNHEIFFLFLNVPFCCL
ncbi:hypothetical protein AtNW77_Chr5g0132461 [Arabidopsis thaliana]|uniref:Uncharacterized protein n=1 Tax=Arabidopsis thaliana x Arabidopsis arenosa TaxID=1240361 RepID=A0A8T2D398_9BRAS|nr:hypothetical protein ISN45_At05g043490 [Arabidopsis thaliana x Arabidopsis arenosa]